MASKKVLDDEELVWRRDPGIELLQIQLPDNDVRHGIWF